MKELFLINFKCAIANVIKTNYITYSYQGFCLPFKNSYFKEQIICAYRAEPYP